MAARVGGRIRKGVTNTAVAAAAMAALTASQAPVLDFVEGGKDTLAAPPSGDLPADGNGPYHTELPPLTTPGKPGASRDLPGGAKGDAQAGIPASALAAYKKAEKTLGVEHPGCRLPWELLAAIGKVESGQARGGALDADGTTVAPILGPVLNGVGFAKITDTDDGAYDGDRTFDRAVGPMQFIPSTWAKWGADGNSDGLKNPNNIYDAALAAGRYLCADGRDLSVKADLERAILSYNHSRDYLKTVLSWMEYYRKGAHAVPDGTGSLPDSPGPGNASQPAPPAKSSGDNKPGDNQPGEARKPNSLGPAGSGSLGTGSGKDGDSEGPSASPRPTVSAGGSVGPGSSEPTRTPTPTRSGTQEPDPEPTGSETPGEPSPTPTECPTGPADPSPSATESASGTPSPTTSPDPSPSDEPAPSTDPDPKETGDPDDPKDPQDEDPCGDPADRDGSSEHGDADGDKPSPAPTPSASQTVSGRLR